MYFGTSESVGNNDYIGLGNSSNSFLRNTLLVPYDCIINLINFSLRQLAAAVEYRAYIVVNNIVTSQYAIISDGSTNYKVSQPCLLQVSQLDLISIQIQYNNGALSNGVVITLSMDII